MYICSFLLLPGLIEPKQILQVFSLVKLDLMALIASVITSAALDFRDSDY